MGSKNKTLNNLQVAYNQLLTKFQSDIESATMESTAILKLIDEIRLFWGKHLDLIDFELENLENSKEKILLSGASYLDVKEAEHYYFTLFGDYHVMGDPLLRLEGFFRIDDSKFRSEDVFNVFKKAYYDTLKVTKEYSGSIHVLPIKKISSKYESDKWNLFNTFYWRFISSILASEIPDESVFFKQYNSLAEIERNIDNFILDRLIFNNLSDIELSLEQRCEAYKNLHPQFQGLSNIETFKVATFSYVAQNLDILITSVSTGFTPYIRDDITFGYFLLLKDTFTDDEKIKEMIEKTILFYIMYKTVPSTWLVKYNFDDFRNIMKKSSILKRVNERLSESNLSVLNSRVDPIRKIIHEEIEKLINIQSSFQGHT